MNLLNIGSRQTGQSTASARLSIESQNSSKSPGSSVSATFGKTLRELEAAQTAKEASAGSDTARQNFAAVLSNSRATLPRTSGSAASSGSSTPAPATAATDPPETAATGLFEQIIAAEQSSAGTPNTPSAGQQPSSGQQPSTGQQPPSAVTPAAPPTPYVLTQMPSTDPNVYTTMSYSEQLNYSIQEQMANDENARRYQNYMTEFQNWQTNGSQGQPPQPPVYETVDQNGFNQWWAEYQQNMSPGGSYVPPDVSMFLINAPDYGNGYYGASGTSQVGTLYNPTGPATAAQIQAANNAAGTNTNSSVVQS